MKQQNNATVVNCSLTILNVKKLNKIKTTINSEVSKSTFLFFIKRKQMLKKQSICIICRYSVYQLIDFVKLKSKFKSLPLKILLKIKFGEEMPENNPDAIANIAWSSLLSKETGKKFHKRSMAIPPKNNRKYLYLGMNHNWLVNINILTNG